LEIANLKRFSNPPDLPPGPAGSSRWVSCPQAIKQLTYDDLENLIEQKILEILGDPDINLELRDEFKRDLYERLKKDQEKIPHEEVVKRFG
jgi:hypothetical protein